MADGRLERRTSRMSKRNLKSQNSPTSPDEEMANGNQDTTPSKPLTLPGDKPRNTGVRPKRRSSLDSRASKMSTMSKKTPSRGKIRRSKSVEVDSIGSDHQRGGKKPLPPRSKSHSGDVDPSKALADKLKNGGQSSNPLADKLKGLGNHTVASSLCILDDNAGSRSVCEMPSQVQAINHKCVEEDIRNSSHNKNLDGDGKPKRGSNHKRNLERQNSDGQRLRLPHHLNKEESGEESKRRSRSKSASSRKKSSRSRSTSISSRMSAATTMTRDATGKKLKRKESSRKGFMRDTSKSRDSSRMKDRSMKDRSMKDRSASASRDITSMKDKSLKRTTSMRERATKENSRQLMKDGSTQTHESSSRRGQDRDSSMKDRSMKDSSGESGMSDSSGNQDSSSKRGRAMSDNSSKRGRPMSDSSKKSNTRSRSEDRSRSKSRARSQSRDRSRSLDRKAGSRDRSSSLDRKAESRDRSRSLDRKAPARTKSASNDDGDGNRTSSSRPSRRNSVPRQRSPSAQGNRTSSKSPSRCKSPSRSPSPSRSRPTRRNSVTRRPSLSVNRSSSRSPSPSRQQVRRPSTSANRSGSRSPSPSRQAVRRPSMTQQRRRSLSAKPRDGRSPSPSKAAKDEYNDKTTKNKSDHNNTKSKSDHNNDTPTAEVNSSDKPAPGRGVPNRANSLMQRRRPSITPQRGMGLERSKTSGPGTTPLRGMGLERTSGSLQVVPHSTNSNRSSLDRSEPVQKTHSVRGVRRNASGMSEMSQSDNVRSRALLGDRLGDRSDPVQKTSSFRAPARASSRSGCLMSDASHQRRTRRSISRRNTANATDIVPYGRRNTISPDRAPPVAPVRADSLRKDKDEKLDESLNSLLSDYNNEREQSGNDSVSLHDSCSTAASEMDASLMSQAEEKEKGKGKDEGKKKKSRASMASRVLKKTLGVGRSSKGKKKNQETEAERELREFEEKLSAALTRKPTSSSNNNSNDKKSSHDKNATKKKSELDKKVEDDPYALANSTIDQGSFSTHTQDNLLGLDKSTSSAKDAKSSTPGILKRVRRRVSMKPGSKRPNGLDKSQEEEEEEETADCTEMEGYEDAYDIEKTSHGINNSQGDDTEESTERDDDGNDEQLNEDKQKALDKESRKASRESRRAAREAKKTAEKESRKMEREEKIRKAEKERKSQIPSHATTPMPKRGKLSALSRLAGRKKSKSHGMQQLNDSFHSHVSQVSLNTVDKAILATDEAMKQALHEFGIDVEASASEGMDVDDMDTNLALDAELSLNMMKSFAQLDFIGLGMMPDPDEGDDDPLDFLQKTKAVTEAIKSDAEQPLGILNTQAGHRPKLVVSRKSGNTKSQSEHSKGEAEKEGGTPKKSRERRKKMTRSATDGGTGETFDWENHANKIRRSKSLTALRASQQQRNKQKLQSKNGPRGTQMRRPSDRYLLKDKKEDDLDDSEGSLDESILSESMEEESRNGEEVARSLPAVLHSSNNGSYRYGTGHASSPEVEVQ